MKLLLKRIFRAPGYTIGKLYVNGVYLCDTLEDRDRDYNHDGDIDDKGEEKVFGQTCIPSGTYQIVLTLSPHFKRILPELLHVPHFDKILIHAGNRAEDSRGCILIGENKAKGLVINSKHWERVLMSKLKGESNITITIE